MLMWNRHHKFDSLIESQQILLGPNAMRFTQSYIWDPTSGQATRPLAMFNSNSKTLRDANLSDARFDDMLDNAQNIHYYTHDANKNVTELISDSGDISAHYEYSPFGATIASSGDLSYSNPFQFSSEFSDHPLGLIYYNYRHYNPLDGRWISRDNIEEEGGFNLYGFIVNNVLNMLDFIGRLPQNSATPKTSDASVDTDVKDVLNDFYRDMLADLIANLPSNTPMLSCLKKIAESLKTGVMVAGIVDDVTKATEGLSYIENITRKIVRGFSVNLEEVKIKLIEIFSPNPCAHSMAVAIADVLSKFRVAVEEYKNTPKTPKKKENKS